MIGSESLHAIQTVVPYLFNMCQVGPDAVN